MNRLLLVCSVSLVLVVALTLAVAAKGKKELPKASLSVNGARPVLMAAEMLEKDFGWVITYEDPPYVHESDVVDVTNEVRRDLDQFKPGQAPRVLVPKGGELTFEFDIDPVTEKPADPAAVIQQLLDAYAFSGHPGIFRLEKDGQRFHLIAVGVKNKDGVLVSRQSLLDTPITITAQKRNGVELVSAICAAISEVSGTRVLAGEAPANIFFRYHTEAGAKNQKARDFLTNELDRMRGAAKLSWKLLYTPDMKTYYLNIHLVSTSRSA